MDMLILTRKEGQSIKIGDNIVITIGAFGRDQVKIAIEAPRDVPILRDDAIRKEKRRASY